MELLLTHYEKWSELYNCSKMSTSQWEAERNPFRTLGVFYCSLGTTTITAYLICLKVMWGLRQNSCYKIMMQIGVMDVSTLLINTLFAGYVAFNGFSFCDIPLSNYVLGSIVVGTWANCCASSIMLAINRSIELWFPSKMSAIFGGYRILPWMAVPFAYQFYFTWYTPACTYNSKAHAWFYYPFAGFSAYDDLDQTLYANIPEDIHNVSTCFIIAGFYVFLTFTLWYKSRNTSNRAVTTMQKKLIIQACYICSFELAACLLYTYIHYVEIRLWLNVLTNMCWISCNCGAAVIYITLNETIRRGFLETVLPKFALEKLQPKSTVFSTTVFGHSSVAPRMSVWVDEHHAVC
ncbi:hypothetical protein QR680_010097 [Steinernema hermaphroditum]|uniref:7TM GPCR serpentine receptor class x (Srx) domain-containing protein n=1 Tax=Steinernema hermaphroditum TaxID=289476 RepID=A0AA39IMQ2_9BILA|nr:hypothetical protein QR680_010097 [Steinernema hermaphroditum]